VETNFINTKRHRNISSFSAHATKTSPIHLERKESSLIEEIQPPHPNAKKIPTTPNPKTTKK